MVKRKFQEFNNLELNNEIVKKLLNSLLKYSNKIYNDIVNCNNKKKILQKECNKLSNLLFSISDESKKFSITLEKEKRLLNSYLSMYKYSVQTNTIEYFINNYSIKTNNIVRTTPDAAVSYMNYLLKKDYNYRIQKATLIVKCNELKIPISSELNRIAYFQFKYDRIIKLYEEIRKEFIISLKHNKEDEFVNLRLRTLFKNNFITYPDDLIKKIIEDYEEVVDLTENSDSDKEQIKETTWEALTGDLEPSKAVMSIVEEKKVYKVSYDKGIDDLKKRKT